MWELIPTFAACCFFAGVSHVSSQRDKLGNYIKREKFFYCIAVAILICFVGLRTMYNDTGAYIFTFENCIDNTVPFFSYFKEISWKIGDNPLFYITNNTLALMHFSVQSMMMFYAAVTIIPIFWFIDKYSSNVFLSVYLSFTLDLVMFSCAALKQCVAIAIGLIAIDKFLNKKYVFYVVLLIIAILFHPYILLFFLAPFLMFKPWTNKTYWLLIISVIGGLLLQVLMSRVTAFTAALGDGYSTEELSSGAGVNFFRVAVSAVPVLLSFILKKKIPQEDYTKELSLILNFSMVFAGLMFVSMFGTAFFFTRVAYYFLIFPVIILPWLFRYFDERYRTLIILVAVVLYFFYLYYGAVMSSSFDDMFSKITLKEYLKNDLDLLP